MDKTTNRQTTRLFSNLKWVGREIGKYQVEKVLLRHKSRQTVSLKVLDREANRPVVLKVFGPLSEISIIEFEKENAAYKKLKHTSRHGVITPLDTFEYEGNFVIVTEYKNGGDLRKWLKTKPKITEILDIFARIAESIDYIHENRIIHRDIKPENVVYEEVGEKITPYLTDFGISVTLSETTSSFMTRHGAGTTRYMAPEFFSDAQKTKAVDIYAFGVMLYEALEERHPIASTKDREIIAQIVSGVVPAAENTIKWLGRNAGSILAKALSKNPKDRPDTATEIILQMDSQYIKYIDRTFDKYVIEEYIGRGPYGATYKACELDNKSKKVTLKLLLASQVRLPEIGRLKELERSKGILPIIDIGYENGVQYLVTEYLNGHNLRHLLTPEGLEIQDVLEIVKPLSKTLDYLHGKAIIHGNLKPENILLRKHRTNGGLQPFVDDYGVSKVAGTNDVLNTGNNVLLGDLVYLAPEILENKQPSFAADVYSLGVIVYEAIEGKTPFGATSLPALIRQKLDGNVLVPENLLKKGGVKAVKVLLRALNARPERRQSTAFDLVSQLEDAIKNRAHTDKRIFTESWVRSRKLISSFRKNSNMLWASVLLLFLIFWGIFSFQSAHQTIPPVAATPDVPTATLTSTVTPTITSSVIPTPLPVSTPTFMLSDQCKLPTDSLDHDFPVSKNLLLEDVYKKQFDSEPDSNDLYAIAYYNNRKILEGHSQYTVIDPISLDVKRGSTIFIPPQQWIVEYKKLPATIPQPAQVKTPSKLYVSGSTTLSHLSAQMAKCSAEVTGIKLVQSDLGNTASGLQDLCQGKVDMFGANREVVPEMGCPELEKFEVARYAMVIFINKNNPSSAAIQKNPLSGKELANLLIDAYLWRNARGSLDNGETITRHYPPLESGEFEVVKDGIFPDTTVFDISGLTIHPDKQSLLDSVAKDANAIGMVDYASFQNYENKNQLIVLPVNGVYASSAVTDNASTYPLMATLYLYVGKHSYETDETLHSFINYYLSHELDFLDDLGYLYPSRKGYAGNRDTVP
ncbi:serine/threonine-protein kinase ULK1 [Anaerolineales bacterium]|nr:serine/threonine-protein kinase ULK1 [Anaerolineales bacterium]